MSIFSWKKKEEEQKAPLRAPQLDVQRLRQTMGLNEAENEAENEAANDAANEADIHEQDQVLPRSDLPKPLTFDTVRIPAPLFQQVAQDETKTETKTDTDTDTDTETKTYDTHKSKSGPILQFLPKKSLKNSLLQTEKRASNQSLSLAEASEHEKSIWKVGLNDAFSLLKTLSLVLVLVYFFSSYVIQRNEVTGVAMEPALYHQDQILINRLDSYFGTIKRGDIVSIRSDRLSERVQVGELIKRVIAIGGDTIEIKNGHVYINDKLLVEPYLSNETETLPIDLTYQKVVLDKNQYYILGDNREDSLDSRFFGPVLDSDIVGVCWLRVSPLHRFGRP